MTNVEGKFPEARLRRLRQSEALRRLVSQQHFRLDQLIMPYFVREGNGVREEISSMPDQYRFSVDRLLKELEGAVKLGLNAVLLFGIPDRKDERATAAWSKQGIVQRAVREIKKKFPDLLVITDVCLCAYMSHGHCGVLDERGKVLNDPTLKILAAAALSHAEAGADMVAPSDMMDGRVRALREALDEKGFEMLPIMSYAAKYASAFYGPFREAAHSSPAQGDRKSYQMDPCNRKEALREIALDIQEGADIVMIKPALAYLDVILEAARTFNVPLAAYAVSGEYSMIKVAAMQGLMDERNVVFEMMNSIVRAGANMVITYHARQIAGWLSKP